MGTALRLLLFLFPCGFIAGQRPPVILIDGYHLLCQGDNPSSSHDFGELEQRLNAQGVRTAFFSTCSLLGKPSIEALGESLGAFIQRLNVPQVDLVTHSMGGLIVRSYLSGKQSSGAIFTPPSDLRVRRWVSVATPNFGALIPAVVSPFLPDNQARQLVPGNRFLFDLATWNQNRDDIRGVDTVAIIGNAGGIGPIEGSNDGTVAVTSASMSFALPDERTRILPYCHGSGDLTSILGLGCDSPPLGKIQSDNPLSWRIIDSFLAGSDEWKTIGHSPNQDPFLSKYGGVLRQTRNRNDTPVGSLVDQPFVTNPPMKGGYSVAIEKPGPQVFLAIPSAAIVSPLSLAPRMLVSIYGNNLAGSAVSLNGRSLSVNYADDHQINTLLPTDLSGIAKLTVSSAAGSQTVNVLIESAAPAIFTADSSGTGRAAAMYTGNFVSLYLTGLGVGSNATSVVLDGKPLRVTYSGPAPLYDGLDQINVELPPGVTEGSVTVIVGRHASNTVSVLVP